MNISGSCFLAHDRVSPKPPSRDRPVTAARNALAEGDNIEKINKHYQPFCCTYIHFILECASLTK